MRHTRSHPLIRLLLPLLLASIALGCRSEDAVGITRGTWLRTSSNNRTYSRATVDQTIGRVWR